jgi:hypothetical protein
VQLTPVPFNSSTLIHPTDIPPGLWQRRLVWPSFAQILWPLISGLLSGPLVLAPLLRITSEICRSLWQHV